MRHLLGKMGHTRRLRNHDMTLCITQHEFHTIGGILVIHGNTRSTCLHDCELSHNQDEVNVSTTTATICSSSPFGSIPRNCKYLASTFESDRNAAYVIFLVCFYGHSRRISQCCLVDHLVNTTIFRNLHLASLSKIQSRDRSISESSGISQIVCFVFIVTALRSIETKCCDMSSIRSRVNSAVQYRKSA